MGTSCSSRKTAIASRVWSTTGCGGTLSGRHPPRQRAPADARAHVFEGRISIFPDEESIMKMPARSLLIASVLCLASLRGPVGADEAAVASAAKVTFRWGVKIPLRDG